MAAVALLMAAHLYRDETLGHFLYSMSLLPQPHASVYDPSWTLERELVFYAIAALTVPIAGIRGLAIVLAALALAGWYLGDPWTFHIVSTRQAGFLAGVVVFLIGASRFGPFVSMVGFGLLIVSRFYDFPFAIPLSMGCILFGMIDVNLPWHRWPLRWLIQIGDASYSVYLLHVLIFMSTSYVAVHLVHLPAWLCEPWRYGSIALCCSVSYWTWRAIELPANDYGSRLADRWKNASDYPQDIVADDRGWHGSEAGRAGTPSRAVH